MTAIQHDTYIMMDVGQTSFFMSDIQTLCPIGSCLSCASMGGISSSEDCCVSRYGLDKILCFFVLMVTGQIISTDFMFVVLG